MTRFVPLSEIASVGLGFKSLQNEFFYVTQEVIDKFKIEPEYLTEIVTLRDLDSRKYIQTPKIATWLFSCSAKQSDLTSTGALKYINAMGSRPAAAKKQSGKAASIREVLSAQGGKLWYAPKAQPHTSHLWLRKGVNTVYAPFIFKKARVLDQRCNYAQPIAIKWPAVGAVISSTVFAYALEVNGSASMGAGVLETPTSKIKAYPVFDPRTLKADQIKVLCTLVEEVWDSEVPVDWSKQKEPGPKLQELDEVLLNYSGSKISLTELYEAVTETCRARIFVAGDKARTTKKQKTDSVGTVAATIAAPLIRYMAARRFPEQFAPAEAQLMSVTVAQEKLSRIVSESFFAEVSLSAKAADGSTLMQGKFPVAVAELIVRALLMGREHFEVPVQAKAAELTTAEFEKWFGKVRDRVARAVDESAVGTGYDAALRNEVYKRLGIHPALANTSLESEIVVK